MAIKQKVNIKGTKDGLIFFLDEECSFDDIVIELKDKLENSHQGILTGPLMKVVVKTGTRSLTVEQQKIVRDVFKARGNLIIKSIENEADSIEEKLRNQVKVINGIVRSGQIFDYDGHLLLIGDVNPGGMIRATGDIYIIGSLKGVAHAGYNGNKEAIIVASIMTPLQLRIANVIDDFRRNDLESNHNNLNEFACIEDEKITIGKTQYFSRLKQAIGTFQ